MQVFIENYNHLLSYYVPGAKKISIRQAYIKLSPKSNHFLDLVKSSGNYDLFFNESGVLHDCFDLDSNELVSFHFDETALLQNIKIFPSRYKFVIGITTIYYDTSNRPISEIYQGRDLKEEDDFCERIYEYGANERTMILLPDCYSPDTGTFKYYYNDLNQIIEEKAVSNEDDLIDWSRFEYNSKSQKVKEISLDEKGIPDGYYEFQYNEKGLDAGYSYYTLPENKLEYSKDRIYQYNERGDWINQILTKDGIPHNVYYRAIEYF